MADITAQKQTVSEERVEAVGSVRVAAGATEIVIALPEPVPAGKELVGTLSLRARYADAQQ